MEKSASQSHKMQLPAFLLAGTFGFLVDISAMALFLKILPPLHARALAFWCAASSTWWVNRTLTFHNRAKKPWARQWGKSIVSSLLAFIPNIGIYAGLMHLWPYKDVELNSSWLDSIQPYLLMPPGIAAGMIVNYCLADRWVFSHRNST